MSVYFYCTVWAIARKSAALDVVTNQQLIDIAIAPGSSPDEGQPWLTEARRVRAGKIESKTSFKMKICAGESRGHCLYVSELSRMHPDLLFIEVSGADSHEEESIGLIKNGETILKCRGVILYAHELFTLLSSRSDDESLYDRVEKACCDLIGKLSGEDIKDAVRQDEHKDFEES